MDCKFTYILPGHILSLAGARAIFLNEHDDQKTAPAVAIQVKEQPTQLNAHVRAYRRWQRRENNRLRHEAWCKEELALREQEEAWVIAQQQKCARLEAEIKGRKANTVNITPCRPHVVKSTVTKQVSVDLEEQCEGLACGGRGKVTWVLETQEFDEEEQDLVKLKSFVCSACNDKHKKKI